MQPLCGKQDYLSVRFVMETLGISQQKAKGLLEKMAVRCDLLRVERNGKTRYMLYPKDLAHTVIPPFNQKDAVMDMAREKE